MVGRTEGPLTPVGDKVSAMKAKYESDGKLLGRGAFSEVRLAHNKKTNQHFAVKIMRKKKLTMKQLRHIYQEVRVLRTLEHESVIKFVDCYEDNKNLYLFSEYAAGGELLDKVIEKDHYEEEDAKIVIRQVVAALKHCHERGVAHRDLKPDNVLLLTKESDTEIRLADFGFAMKFDTDDPEGENFKTALGTPNYVAPEILQGCRYNYRCDIWSLGVMTFVLLSGFLPFGGNTSTDQMRHVLRGVFDFLPADAWQNVSDDAKNFISSLLRREPDDRIDYDQMEQHPWLSSPEKSHGDLSGNIARLRAFQEERKREARAKIMAQGAALMFEEMMLGDDDEEKNMFDV